MMLTLAGFLIRTFVVAAIAIALLRILKKSSAATKHAVAAAALTATLLLGGFALKPDRTTQPTFKSAVYMLPRYVNRSGLELIAGKPGDNSPLADDVRRTDVAVGLLELAYVAGFGFFTIRLIAGLAALGRRIRRAKPLAENPGVLIDPTAASPSTAWWGCNVVLLPKEAETWPSEMLGVVLQHERAHIARNDWWWNMLGNLACAVAWPNPFVWLLQRRRRETSELAVDDAVLNSGLPASTYAQHLLRIAANAAPNQEGLTLAMAGKPQISRRIETLMNQHQRRGAATLAAILSIAGLEAGVVTVLSSWGFTTKDPFTIVLGPAKPASPSPNQFEVTERWYVVDADPNAPLAQATIQGLDSAQLNDLIRRRHGRLMKHGSQTVKTTAFNSDELKMTGGAIASDWIAIDPNDAPHYYKEAVLVHPGMVEFKLQDGKDGSRMWQVYESTVSEGEGTAWLHREANHVCQFSPPIRDHQLVVVSDFK